MVLTGFGRNTVGSTVTVTVTVTVTTMPYEYEYVALFLFLFYFTVVGFFVDQLVVNERTNLFYLLKTENQTRGSHKSRN